MLRKTTLIALAGALALALVLPQPSQAQRRGGIVNWFVYQDPGRLDFIAESPLGVQQVTAGIYSGLLHFDPDDPNKIIPDLALSYAASNADKVYTFKLRQGVKWHDGKPFSSADVMATFDRVLNPQVKSARCGPVMRPIVERVTAPDANTVRFELKFAAGTFIPGLASAWCRIAAKHVLEKFGDLQSPEAQIGTGPFKFKRYERGSVVEWERNPDYFIPGLPYLDGVRQYVLVGRPRQVAAAKAGQIHLWDTWPPMSPSEAREIQSTRGDAVETYKWSISTVWTLHLNSSKPPFDNKDLRRAVNLALDRHELMQKAFEGDGVPCALLEPATSGPFALTMDDLLKMPGCRKDKSQDLAEAERLVKKHHPNGVDVEIAIRTVGNYIDRAQVVADQLRKIGIRGTIKTWEGAAGFAAYARGEYQLIAAQDHAMFLPDPSGIFSLVYVENAGRNWAKWNDPQVNKLANEGLRETNQAKRAQLYHRLQRYLMSEDTPAPVVGWIEGWFFRDKKMKNYNPANTIYDNSTFMKVWLER